MIYSVKTSCRVCIILCVQRRTYQLRQSPCINKPWNKIHTDFGRFVNKTRRHNIKISWSGGFECCSFSPSKVTEKRLRLASADTFRFNQTPAAQQLNSRNSAQRTESLIRSLREFVSGLVTANQETEAIYAWSSLGDARGERLWGR